MAALNPAVLAAFRAGEISAPVALMRLGWDEPDLTAALTHASAQDSALQPLLDLARRTGGGALVQRMRAAGVEHCATTEPVAQARALFEAAATISPDAASALYSFGDPALLAEATRELTALLGRWTSLHEADVLDLGCGSGRLTAALAGMGPRFVLGADIAPAMLAAAARRLRAIPGAALLRLSGETLAPLRTGSLDLIVAVDVFPYLTAGGIEPARRLLAECARVLRPGGNLALFNWSYGSNSPGPEQTAGALGLRPDRHAAHPFSLWDGSAWLFARTA